MKYVHRKRPRPIKAVIWSQSEFYLHRIRTSAFEEHIFVGKVAYVSQLPVKGTPRHGHFFIYYGNRHQPIVRIRWSSDEFRGLMQATQNGRYKESNGMLGDLERLKGEAIRHALKNKTEIRAAYDKNLHSLFDQNEIVVVMGTRIAVRIPYLLLL